MKPLTNQQRLHLINSEQLYENYRVALRHAAAHTYGMRWKTVRGVDYLFRDSDARGNGKSLGPRSEETEAILAPFHQGREAANERLAGIRAALDEQARLNKALRLSRMPRVIARILRELDAAGLYKSFTVLGTQALFGYEAAGGVQFLTELLATGDIGLLYDHRQKQALVSSKLAGQGQAGQVEGDRVELAGLGQAAQATDALAALRRLVEADTHRADGMAGATCSTGIR